MQLSAQESEAGFRQSVRTAHWTCGRLEKSDKPSLLISTLEALAVLFSLMLFFDDVPPEPRTKVQVAPTWTDNRGNGSALNKLMTSRFLASAVLMEMSALLKQRGLRASAQGAPRTANREADRLANGFARERVRDRPGDGPVDPPSKSSGRRETGRAGVPGFPCQRPRSSEDKKTATHRRSVCV